MMTKAEMREEIKALAQSKDVDVDLDDLESMNVAQLQAVLESLAAEPCNDDGHEEVEAEEVEDDDAEDFDPPRVAPGPTVELQLGPSAESPLTAPATALVSGAETSLGGPPVASAKYRWPYTVAQGCAVAGTRKGTIPAFGRIGAGDLPGGQGALDELVAAGSVVHK